MNQSCTTKVEDDSQSATERCFSTLESGTRTSLDTSHYGYVHYWCVIIYHYVWKNFISTWQRTFSSSDITLKRQCMCFPAWSTRCVHPSTSISMSRKKRTHNENIPVTPPNKSFTFSDGFAPKKMPASLLHKKYKTFNEIAKPSG